MNQVVSEIMARLDKPIEDGERIERDAQFEKGGMRRNGSISRNYFGPSEVKEPDKWHFDKRAARQFLTSAMIFCRQVLPAGSPAGTFFDENFSPHLAYSFERLQHSVDHLKGLREEVRAGTLRSLVGRVEDDLSGEFVSIGDRLSDEAGGALTNSVIRVIVAGIVTERRLRALCDRASPPIDLNKSDGSPIPLNAVIAAVRKANLVSEPEQKQLLAWADLRNKAAHGQFEQVSADQGKLMVQGVLGFLSRHPA